ncbi:MAG: 3-phenylpropionate/trans-cinnamate dioxygenase ferredoxin reductase component [Trebonia sp.]|nr:3-phenylpropionate/trans-cinnamate dioxygenase ferredoxin reductase component [Trebonia sp.]
MAKPTFVLLGSGLASVTAASTLRMEGFEGRVIIVGDEPHVPYSRPPLSKDVLRAEKSPEQTRLRPGAWYASNDVELRLGVRAAAVDPGAHMVELADGTGLAYDKLLIATGGVPRTLDIPGADLPGVFFLRRLDDALALREHLTPGTPVAVIGAGFIGAEVAASARTLGCEVIMLEIAEIPLGHALGPEIGQVYADVHRERGVELRTGVGVERIEGHGHVQRVVATDGRVHDASVVVIGVGLVPELDLARRSGLATGNGVIVDEYCQASVDDVFAAGDIANHPNHFLGRRIRVEHWQNAQHQGATAARNMLGRHKPFREVPWVWSDQYEHNLQVVGLPDPARRMVVRGDTATRNFSAFFMHDGRVTAALAVNRPGDIRVARLMIQHGTEAPVAHLADVDADLGQLIMSSRPYPGSW